MAADALTELEYVEAIEKRFKGLRARALLLSPEDLQRVLSWYKQGIPLATVIGVMEEVFAAAAQRRPRRSPRSLAYCEPAIEEAWQDLQEGRVGRRRIQRAAPDPQLAPALQGVATALRASGAPAEVVEEVAGSLERLAGGDKEPRLEQDLVAALEEELCRACLDSMASDDRSALESAASEEIARFAGEMSPQVHTRALSRARTRLLRERFHLPDLSLLPLL